MIDYVAKVHDRNVTSIVAGRERLLMYPKQGFNIQINRTATAPPTLIKSPSGKGGGAE